MQGNIIGIGYYLEFVATSLSTHCDFAITYIVTHLGGCEPVPVCGRLSW